MCYCDEEIETEEPALEFPESCSLLQQINTRYDFRLLCQGSVDFVVSLNYGPPDSSYPAYFGRRE